MEKPIYLGKKAYYAIFTESDLDPITESPSEMVIRLISRYATDLCPHTAKDDILKVIIKSEDWKGSFLNGISKEKLREIVLEIYPGQTTFNRYN